MAEGTGLLNLRRGNSTEGSNPSDSAKEEGAFHLEGPLSFLRSAALGNLSVPDAPGPSAPPTAGTMALRVHPPRSGAGRPRSLARGSLLRARDSEVAWRSPHRWLATPRTGFEGRSKFFARLSSRSGESNGSSSRRRASVREPPSFGQDRASFCGAVGRSSGRSTARRRRPEAMA